MKTIEIRDHDYERILSIHRKKVIEHGEEWLIADTLGICLIGGIQSEISCYNAIERILGEIK